MELGEDAAVVVDFFFADDFGEGGFFPGEGAGGGGGGDFPGDGAGAVGAGGEGDVAEIECAGGGVAGVAGEGEGVEKFGVFLEDFGAACFVGDDAVGEGDGGGGEGPDGAGDGDADFAFLADAVAE